jgi:hypothetical protein
VPEASGTDATTQDRRVASRNAQELAKPLVQASEVDVVVERSRVRDLGGAQNGPLMQIVRYRGFLERPAQVRYTERYSALDRRQLVVVDEDDPAGAQEPPEVDRLCNEKKGCLRFASRLLHDPTHTDAEDGLFVGQSTGR